LKFEAKWFVEIYQVRIADAIPIGSAVLAPNVNAKYAQFKTPNYADIFSIVTITKNFNAAGSKTITLPKDNKERKKNYLCGDIHSRVASNYLATASLLR